MYGRQDSQRGRLCLSDPCLTGCETLMKGRFNCGADSRNRRVEPTAKAPSGGANSSRNHSCVFHFMLGAESGSQLGSS